MYLNIYKLWTNTKDEELDDFINKINQRFFHNLVNPIAGTELIKEKKKKNNISKITTDDETWYLNKIKVVIGYVFVKDN